MRHGTAGLALASALLGACAGPIRAVGEEDRDTSGRYDGLWVGALEAGKPARFERGNWRRSCTSWEDEFFFVVDDGTITFPLRDVDEADAPRAYVAADGAFRLVVPRGEREVSSRESGAVGRSEINWIFAGSLDAEKPRARFTVGDSHYGGGGCSWPLDVARRRRSS